MKKIGRFLTFSITFGLAACSNPGSEFQNSCARLFVAAGETTAKDSGGLCKCIYENFEVGLNKSELENITAFFNESGSVKEFEKNFRKKFTSDQRDKIENMAESCEP